VTTVQFATSDWRFLELSVEDIGPFRNGPEVFSFFGIDPGGHPTAAGPASLFMLLAKNARGKTTALETMFGLLGMLNNPPAGRFSQNPAEGRAQLDIRSTWTIDGRSRTVLLSLWTGSDLAINDWPEERLKETADCQDWARLGITCTPRGIELASGTDDLGQKFFEAVRSNVDFPPLSLFGESQALPTLLYFPAHRRVMRPLDSGIVSRPDGWGYQPSQMFNSDGPDWGTSVDNLLVWLEWLGDDRIEELLDFVNGIIFADEPEKKILRPHRETLRAIVRTPTGDHSLAELSHGERAIFQILTRIVAHMTSSTVVLIDELEIHLHSRWMNRLFGALKELIRRYPAFTIIFTTHNRELLQNFRHNVPEDGIVKGGHLIEDDL
jgi:hypothetical protein